ncbi:MAG: N-acetylneuraminate synthase family protein [Candidatus Tectomicrobia bacterium]|nr:N-acetylneuraminate synthase family protein [Candidatus Tectomicrobia bacterium]
MRQTTIRIGDRSVGNDHPVYIIAEIGINHNGDMHIVKRLIDVAVEAGCDAVKFQKRHLKSIYTTNVLTNLNHCEQAFQYIIPILNLYELSPEQMWEIKRYCDEVGIVFLCTPFDPHSAALLQSMNIPAFKVASADLTNFELIDELVTFQKPLLLSTGMSLESEIDCTVEHLRKRDAQFALLHCVSAYPVDPRDAKLRRITHMIDKYQVPVGYSGHDIGTALSIVATTLGCCIIEKHITLDREMRGPDHKISLLPEELKRLVASVRECEEAILDVRDHILPGEVLNKMVFRKSVVALKPIKKGERIERAMVGVKSPGIGLSGQRMPELVGKVAPRDFEKDAIFYESDLVDDNRGMAVATPNWGRLGFVVRYHDFETALPYAPEALEFHLTYNDTLLEAPHQKLNDFRQELSRIALRVHCCEYIGENLFDLCSKYPDILARSRATLQRVIDLTAELSGYFKPEIPLIVFNVGAMSLRNDFRDVQIDPDAFHAIIKSLDLRNTHLVAQNMPPNPWYFGGQWKGHYFIKAEELIAFCEATGQSVCLDLSHAQMACTYMHVSFAEYIKKLKPYVKHVHVADARGIEGEGVQIGTGDIDFEQFFQVYRDYGETWVPEIWQGHINRHEAARLALTKLTGMYANVPSRAWEARRANPT